MFNAEFRIMICKSDCDVVL